MKLITLAGAGILFILSSCTGTKKIITPATPLYETKWVLKKIHTGKATEEVTTKAFIKFDEAKKSAGGNGSCNTFGSSITNSNTEINFKNIFSTKMYCEGLQQTEDKFLQSLEKVTRYKITANTLQLYNGNTILLEFIGA